MFKRDMLIQASSGSLLVFAQSVGRIQFRTELRGFGLRRLPAWHKARTEPQHRQPGQRRPSGSRSPRELHRRLVRRLLLDSE